MIPVSVVIITCNEEKNIEKCLKSISWVDEIVVVDSGSSDKTTEICRRYNCLIYDSPWLGFGKTKQLAVSKAKHDWIISIDADEEFTPELNNEIKELMQSEPPYYGYRIRRNSFYLGKMIRHCGWNKDFTLRLFNRMHGNFNDKTVHEFVVVEGTIGVLTNTMFHYTYPDLNSHFCKMKRYAELGAEQLYVKSRESTPFAALLRGLFKFFKMFFLQVGFLDGKHGFLLSVNSAWGIYLKYLLLWEKKKSKSSI